MQNQPSPPQTSVPQNSKTNLINERLPPRVSTYYRIFSQIIGLFDSIPPRIFDDPNHASITKTFREIKTALDDKFRVSPKKLDVASIAADLYRLEIILVRLLPVEDLIFRLEGYRQDFGSAVGEQQYFAYLNSIGYRQSLEASTNSHSGHDDFIRADAIYLISQIQHHQMLREGAESARSYLISRLWRYTSLVITILSIPIILFFSDLLYFRPHGTFSETGNGGRSSSTSSKADSQIPVINATFFQATTPSQSPTAEPSSTPDESSSEESVPEPAEASSYSEPPGESRFSVLVAESTTLSFICIVGALGAFVSAANRIQRLGLNHELMRNSFGLESSAAQLKWTPIIGLIFAFILSLIFGGGLVQGGLFPRATIAKSWLTILYEHDQLAILLVWCFIAGFSERFVPDLLDRLLLQSKGNAPNEKSRQPTMVVTEAPNAADRRKDGSSGAHVNQEPKGED